MSFGLHSYIIMTSNDDVSEHYRQKMVLCAHRLAQKSLQSHLLSLTKSCPSWSWLYMLLCVWWFPLGLCMVMFGPIIEHSHVISWNFGLWFVNIHYLINKQGDATLCIDLRYTNMCRSSTDCMNTAWKVMHTVKSWASCYCCETWLFVFSPNPTILDPSGTRTTTLELSVNLLIQEYLSSVFRNIRVVYSGTFAQWIW